jgi:hypothetical protein
MQYSIKQQYSGASSPLSRFGGGEKMGVCHPNYDTPIHCSEQMYLLVSLEMVSSLLQDYVML